MGVTEYAIQRGVRGGEFMLSLDYFLARISSVKKGYYHGADLVVILFGQYSVVKHEEIKPFLFGLAVILPQYFGYADTHGIDMLTIR